MQRGDVVDGEEGVVGLAEPDPRAVQLLLDDPVSPFGSLIEEVRFAVDSPLEGDGFEPSVPSCDRPSANS